MMAKLSLMSILSEMSFLNRRMASHVAAAEVLLRAEVPALSKPLEVLVPDFVV